MMKIVIKIILLLLVFEAGYAQDKTADSLEREVQLAKTDSVKFLSLNKVVTWYRESNRDSAIFYLGKIATLTKENGKTLDEAGAYNTIGYELLHLGKISQALQYLQLAIKLEEDSANDNKTWNPNKIKKGYSTRLNYLGYGNLALAQLMWGGGNDSLQIVLNKKAEHLAVITDDKLLLSLTNMNLGKAYGRLKILDSALIFEKRAVFFTEQTDFKLYLGSISRYSAAVYLKKQNYPLALLYFQKALADALPQHNIFEASADYSGISYCFLKMNNADSALYYAKKDLEAVLSLRTRDLDGPYQNLYKSYELKGEKDSAYKYQGLLLAVKEKILTDNAAGEVSFQTLFIKEQQRSLLLDKEREVLKTRLITYLLLIALAIFILLASIFYRNNRQKQKANKLLHRQKEEIQEALSMVKSTQTQLVQREKMASLGELTAGIAHEIQNPLNFVNNFSDVNREMIDELKEELQRGDIETAIDIANDIQQNEEKINHHGKRAEGIVKSMLQHSHVGGRAKEPTDVNKLADEYLRLSYHGLRAKDKTFNAELITNFDWSLSKVDIVQQDIGRVLLNMFNNAFYAMKEKQKKAEAGYQPNIEVITAINGKHLEIKVKDNGNGIPVEIKDKIMQPFFTTKPAGEGTGLGLSLSYDIVVKGHGGSISVNSIDGEYSIFTVSIPINT